MLQSKANVSLIILPFLPKMQGGGKDEKQSPYRSHICSQKQLNLEVKALLLRNYFAFAHTYSF